MYEDEDIKYRTATFIGIAIVVGAIILVVPNFLRMRASGTFTACLSNEKNIGEALVKYSKDNNGNYPYTLSALTPKYLKAIPTCPKARRDTYSLYYRISKDRKRYTFFCQGSNHRDVGITEKNWPQYNSEDGLQYRL